MRIPAPLNARIGDGARSPARRPAAARELPGARGRWRFPGGAAQAPEVGRLQASPRSDALQCRVDAAFGPRGKPAQARLDTELPGGQFRKQQVSITELNATAAEFARAAEATRIQHQVLAAHHVASPQSDRLRQVAPVAAGLPGLLTGKFSASKRNQLVADHARVRAAEQDGLPAAARAEVDRLYAPPHVPSGNTLNKKLKGIFASAASPLDVRVGLPVLRSLIRAATDDDRKAAATNPRLLAQAVAMVQREDYAAYVIELGVQQTGTVEQTSAAAADELIRAAMARWAPTRDIGGLSIAGHVAILKGAAWEHLVRTLFGGRLPGGQLTTLLNVTNAFEREGVVYINADRGNAGTMIHEGVHKYAPNAFLDRYGEPLNEGVTEWFARQICAAQTPPIVRSQYQDRYDAAQLLVQRAGEAALRRAYFAGEFGALSGVEIPVVD